MSEERNRRVFQLFLPLAVFIILFNFVIVPLNRDAWNLGWFVFLGLIAVGLFFYIRIRNEGGEIPILGSLYG